MSKKRSADTELNHENWADEDQTDEAGVFKMASQDVMRERKVITAKRRTAGQSSSSSEGLFAAFKGFSSSTSSQHPPGTFDFCKVLNKPTALESSVKSAPNSSNISASAVNPFANLLAKIPSGATQSTPLSNLQANPPASSFQVTKPSCNSNFQNKSASTSTPQASKPADKLEKPTTNHSKRIRCEEDTAAISEDNSKKDVSASQKVFEEKVKNLNIMFLHFIHTKVKANPYVILLPPMMDYKKYVEKYTKEKLESENTEKLKKDGFKFDIPPQGSSASFTIQNNASSEKKTFIIGSGEDKTSTSKPSDTYASFKFTASAKDTNGPEATSRNEKEQAIMNFSSPSKSENKVQSFSFANNTGKDDSQPAKLPAFSWGAKPENTTEGKENKEAPSFPFGLKSDKPLWGSKEPEKNETHPGLKPFSFFTLNTASSISASSTTDSSSNTTAAVKPFSFGFSSAPLPAPKAEEEDEDEPLPKEEVKEIVEDDSIFNIKAKIFVMKEDKSYGERGVGNLFVKPIQDKVKAQVIVRTETDTGKIIFNILVSKQVPIKREKNNLILITIPHPTTEKNPKPTTCLVRVKTQEDAEKLLACLEQFKK